MSNPSLDAEEDQSPFTDEAEHIPVRAFRKRLASICKARKVVLIGGHSSPAGIFIPLSVGRYSGHQEILIEARRTLRKVKTIARYRQEAE